MVTPRNPLPKGPPVIGTICWSSRDPKTFDIELMQREGNKLFRVTYGLEVQDNLDRLDACLALGTAIFHRATLHGLIDA